MSVADYRRASSITHDYDGPVLQEGIKSILAVPVVVAGRSRAVLYGAYRAAAPIGDRTADLMIASARRLSRELSIRDEVDRRLRLRDTHLAGVGSGGTATEEAREVHAQLRRLAADPSAPPALRAQLRVLAERLTRGKRGGPAAALSARELDVLAQVALDCTNAEAAKRLSLKPETVKSYLRSATAKLGAHTRHEAVAKARLARLLP
jgi:DNA-binding CsgD family transcriptional regulator